MNNVVYVKTDSIGRIIAVNSDAFIDPTGWIKIDEGSGVRYMHAQNNYFPHAIIDDRGIFRYKLIDGMPVERTAEEMDADYVPPVSQPTTEERIAVLEVENAQLKEALDLLLSGETEVDADG